MSVKFCLSNRLVNFTPNLRAVPRLWPMRSHAMKHCQSACCSVRNRELWRVVVLRQKNPLWVSSVSALRMMRWCGSEEWKDEGKRWRTVVGKHCRKKKEQHSQKCLWTDYLYFVSRGSERYLSNETNLYCAGCGLWLVWDTTFAPVWACWPPSWFIWPGWKDCTGCTDDDCGLEAPELPEGM